MENEPAASNLTEAWSNGRRVIVLNELAAEMVAEEATLFGDQS